MLRTAAVVLCVALWSGCLVTDEITFNDEPDLPPSILSSPSSEPIGGVFWVDAADRRSEVEIKVQIRDENVRQDLAAHWRLRRKADNERLPIFSSDAIEGGDEPVRDFAFHFSSEGLIENECYRLELAVSGSFYVNKSDPMYFDQVPAGRESDRAYAWWWVWEGRNDDDADNFANIAETCITSENLLNAPPPATEEQQ